ncbi:hypothetical protein CRV01_01185 [Arcobacter sp. CECT 8983]|uniref:hypothetical protein n=1 Tax=Arcobacter sp. CECT 8983 TaxID=2044508 RepID=UPI00100A6264|nr:hypothetical protein [Arcobacter sp. CECT 8983]RXJ91734.1 hypothetical protein CRV01_01185 [Arcobacter sp. CECT 8983]
MASYYEEFIQRHEFENPLNRIVYEIVNCIKLRKDYNGAVGLILQNKITLEDVALRTVRLSLNDFITLADTLISRK